MKTGENERKNERTRMKGSIERGKKGTEGKWEGKRKVSLICEFYTLVILSQTSTTLRDALSFNINL